jgi:hypothetical protein
MKVVNRYLSRLLYEVADYTIRRVETSIENSRFRLERFVISSVERVMNHPRPVYVHLFSPSTGLYSKRVPDLPLGVSAQVRFAPQCEISAGAIITTTGRCTIENACVGNMAQIVGVPSSGPLVVTQTSATVGCYS